MYEKPIRYPNRKLRQHFKPTTNRKVMYNAITGLNPDTLIDAATNKGFNIGNFKYNQESFVSKYRVAEEANAHLYLKAINYFSDDDIKKNLPKWLRERLSNTHTCASTQRYTAVKYASKRLCNNPLCPRCYQKAMYRVLQDLEPYRKGNNRVYVVAKEYELPSGLSDKYMTEISKAMFIMADVEMKQVTKALSRYTGIIQHIRFPRFRKVNETLFLVPTILVVTDGSDMAYSQLMNSTTSLIEAPKVDICLDDKHWVTPVYDNDSLAGIIRYPHEVLVNTYVSSLRTIMLNQGTFKYRAKNKAPTRK